MDTDENLFYSFFWKIYKCINFMRTNKNFYGIYAKRWFITFISPCIFA